ncbi:hypothetical protein MB02_00190 [Croceicoccus estronivorus]|uniref:putative quinol monooxygenase n=1 Tax=Croceicoccus estronivorus TaxID=1172626 RepID=UPI0008301019|nr:antibiotic biosynthesis monooxygenase family protein [Croceicoccus estronivorus]OCC25154.1 hypothetical protein MB02_00190 [Croceicoccus estronivorus]
MAIRVIYEMTAQTDQGDAFTAVLADLATTIRGLPGCEGVDVLRRQDNPDQFLFMEKWPSGEVYDEAAKMVPKTAFAPLKPLLGGPPARSVHELLES